LAILDGVDLDKLLDKDLFAKNEEDDKMNSVA
jgi:hypothetical protein